MENLDFDYQAQADEFRAASELLALFATPEGSRELLDVLTSGDHDRFHRIANRVTWPETDPRLICHKACEIIGGRLGKLHKVVECRLRANLSPEERLAYMRIWLRHFGFVAVAVPAVDRPIRPLFNTGDVIPAGPFLDDLKAAGLVTCTEKYLPAVVHCEIVCD